MVEERWPEKKVLGALRRIFHDYTSAAEAIPFQRLKDRFERERATWLRRVREVGSSVAVLDPSLSDDRSHAPQLTRKRRL
jgi:hypothetical protein